VRDIVEREKETHLPSASSFNGSFAPDEDMIVKTRRMVQTSNFSRRCYTPTTMLSLPCVSLPSPSSFATSGLKKPGSSPEHHSLHPETTYVSSHLGPSPLSPRGGRFNRLFVPENSPNSRSLQNRLSAKLSASKILSHILTTRHHPDSTFRCPLQCPHSSFCDDFKP
jgi:hypothetical protein